MGAFNRSAVVTLVERRSRLLLLGELPFGHGAQDVYDCLRGLCADLPAVTRRTITWDQGREMAEWVQLEVDADVEVYFCDPHSPWQRPSNKHMNGLLRQYFPKGTDLGLVSRKQLRAVAAEMNGRPRKVLGWRTPAEVYADIVATALDRAISSHRREHSHASPQCPCLTISLRLRQRKSPSGL